MILSLIYIVMTLNDLQKLFVIACYPLKKLLIKNVSWIKQNFCHLEIRVRLD